jgi:protein transport protein SEC61 subunit alpha
VLALHFRQQQLTLPNYKTQSVYSVLEQHIPTAAMLGGVVIGLLTILGEMMNITGSTTGILLSVSILYRFYQKLKE